MNGTINYGHLMHKAMRGLMADLLTEIGRKGLPGEHHFFITFDTNYPGVDIADHLHERYPEDMTIVVQHWFDNLVVMDDRFTITLNFGDVPEPLVIPFEAIKTFVDPSVEFGLRFDGHEEEDSPLELEEDEESPMMVVEEDVESPPKEAEVVSLDAFRKS